MQLIHLADTHVGARPYHLDRLQRHVMEAFNKAVEYILEVKPGLVVVAGDLLDRPRPENEVFIHVLRSLKEIAGRGVKVILAHGEHDTPGRRDRTMLEVIAEAVEGVYAPRPGGSSVEERVAASILELGGATVGVYQFYKTHIENQRAFAQKLLPLYGRMLAARRKPRVFVAHIGLEGALMPDAAVANVRDLPRVEYAALGHHHGRWIIRPEEGPSLAVYPGSLYPLNVREARSQHKRGPILVDLSGDEPVIQEEYGVVVAKHIVAPETRLEDPLHVEARLREAVARALKGRRGVEEAVVHLPVALAPSVPRARVESSVSRVSRALGVVVVPHIHRLVYGVQERVAGDVVEAGLDPVELVKRLYGVGDETARLVIALKDALASGDVEEANSIIDRLAEKGELLRIAREKGLR
ncbi:MAG: metallophosphoesterase family protein [Desulfurococcales archaeon]|nr:metallophosphoesterase family protein [Desulfurococcales archaeon]